LVNEIKNAALSVNGVRDCKDITLVNLGSDLHVTLTIKIPSFSWRKNEKNEGSVKNNNETKMSINEAHEIATEVQNKIIVITRAARVVVHTEPE
jgi:divalent metal cation (Fe/Co/Zn/Cd) transporter